ncbi:M43 family zinc metalloprotease [Flavobacterium sp. CAU 1735]|uniref:M43 family zinc metalloprotease n=1 Tax=Flavobacterium sp. CAU 1735 TaxID=3140361 RepID=UPI003261A22A
MKKHLFFIVLFLKITLLFSQGGTREAWLRSGAPNYDANKNLNYAYSNNECVLFGNSIISIPMDNSYIHLIDFYGEGRIVDHNLVSGFKDAYNINHEYQLVSNGPDRGHRIPNRIPVPNYYGDLQLSSYVASDRVSNITLMGAPILQNTAQEMARMIRKDGKGKIIIYGFGDRDSGVVILEKELKKINFQRVEHNFLEPPFDEISGFPHAPRVYKSKKISIVGEKVFWSLNPKLDHGVTQEEMMTLDFTSLLKMGADLSGGIKGTIDKSGGKISIEVYPYDNDGQDGIQKLVALKSFSRDKLIYGVYTDTSNVNEYVGLTKKIPYGFIVSEKGESFEVLGETDSNDIKLLAANSKSGWEKGACSYSFLRGLMWFGWMTGGLYNMDKPNSPNAPCEKIITHLQSGRQPVVVKITIKDATLYDFKIPGVTGGSIVNFVEDKGSSEYKVIKRLVVTILESPEDFREATFYKARIMGYITEANRYYTAKTGNVKNAAISAEIGNPRILFNSVDLILKKATTSRYNYNIVAQEKLFESEANIKNNNDETMQLVYVHSLTKYYPRAPAERVIRGMSKNGGATISNSDYTVFSYSRMFDDDPDVYGTPGSTLAHEFGHYFDLDHPFQGGCHESGGGDNISDTPPAEGAFWYLKDPGGPNERGIENPCENPPTCHNQRRQIENIMDYGPCRWFFTKGQEERMMRRIKTKQSLYNSMWISDISADPHEVNITVNDQRDHSQIIRKRELKDNQFSMRLRMLYPTSQKNYYNLEIFSDLPQNATVQIFDIHSTLLYKAYYSIKNGLNYFPIKSRFFKKGGLYLVTYINDEGRTEKIKFLGSQ